MSHNGGGGGSGPQKGGGRGSGPQVGSQGQGQGQGQVGGPAQPYPAGQYPGRGAWSRPLLPILLQQRDGGGDTGSVRPACQQPHQQFGGGGRGGTSNVHPRGPPSCSSIPPPPQPAGLTTKEQETIDHLRLVATTSTLPGVSHEAILFAENSEQRQGYYTLSAWSTILNLNISSINGKEVKRLLGGILAELRVLHSSGYCHGNLAESNILVSKDKVKLVNLSFCEYNDKNIQSDYRALASVIKQFYQSRTLPKDVLHLVQYLESTDKGLYKKPMLIFNHPCTWDTDRVRLVVDYLVNRIRRSSLSVCGKGISEAVELLSGSDWVSKVNTSEYLSFVYNSHYLSSESRRIDRCLLQFMGDVYAHADAHPPLTQKNTPTQAEVENKFHQLFPDFLCMLVEKLAAKNLVTPGDPIDRKYVGATNFWSIKTL